MENLQPPTPKEEVIIAKNPFETDFDLKCNSSMVVGGPGGGGPTSTPMFHSSAPGASGMLPNNSIPGNTPHYFQKQYHNAYPPSVFGMGGPHTMLVHAITHVVFNLREKEYGVVSEIFRTVIIYRKTSHFEDLEKFQFYEIFIVLLGFCFLKLFRTFSKCSKAESEYRMEHYGGGESAQI